MPVLFKPKEKPDTYINVIYLEINTCVRSTCFYSDKKVIDFGTIPVKYKKNISFELNNNFAEELNLKMQMLPLYCGFQFLNILKPLAPQDKAIYSVSFQPEYA